MQPVRVSRQFSEDFEAVAARYRLRELGEYEQARQTARNDIEAATECYAALAVDGNDEQL